MADANSDTNPVNVKNCERCGTEFYRPTNGDAWYFTRKKRFCSSICAAAASQKHQPLSERLFANVAKSRPNGCWYWTGCKTAAGYGRFSFHNSEVYAHRTSYEIHKGPIPSGLSVCHECDNPACVNPNHLFLGSQADNMHDMIGKGRAKLRPQLGEEHGEAKLTEAQVMQIREDTRNQRTIAADYGISQTNVSDIKRRKIWKHLP